VTIPVTIAPAVAPPPSPDAARYDDAPPPLPDAARGDVDSSSEPSITWSEVCRQNMTAAALVAASHGPSAADVILAHLDRSVRYEEVRSTSRPSSRSRSPLRTGHDDA
jgi:hypothetical protein